MTVHSVFQTQHPAVASQAIGRSGAESDFRGARLEPSRGSVAVSGKPARRHLAVIPTREKLAQQALRARDGTQAFSWSQPDGSNTG
ncbi:MAG: hypothetical protein DMG27_20825 [Acidobacteria bacterium]|nr:MAG: hypothetical protein DMG27_20825 [Acidobacteriota bacterium]